MANADDARPQQSPADALRDGPAARYDTLRHAEKIRLGPPDPGRRAASTGTTRSCGTTPTSSRASTSTSARSAASSARSSGRVTEPRSAPAGSAAGLVRLPPRLGRPVYAPDGWCSCGERQASLALCAPAAASSRSADAAVPPSTPSFPHQPDGEQPDTTGPHPDATGSTATPRTTDVYRNEPHWLILADPWTSTGAAIADVEGGHERPKRRPTRTFIVRACNSTKTAARRAGAAAVRRIGFGHDRGGQRVRPRRGCGTRRVLYRHLPRKAHGNAA